MSISDDFAPALSGKVHQALPVNVIDDSRSKVSIASQVSELNESTIYTKQLQEENTYR
jgi:hypothetical protein